MDCLAKVIRSCCCVNFMKWRNENLVCYERCFKVFSCILCLWSMVMIATGLQFANIDWFDKAHKAVQNVGIGLQVFVVFFSFFGMMFAVFGFCVARKRKCHTAWVAVFGVLIFFFGVIPILSELTAIRMITNLNEEDIDYYCNKTKKELQEEPKFIRTFFEFAHRFDELSEKYLNMHMCTDLCPCNDGTINVKKPPKTSPLHFLVGSNFWLSGKQKYQLKSNADLLKNASRHFPSRRTASPPLSIEMKFTDNYTKGYWTFKECLDDKRHSASEFAYSFGKEEDPKEAYKDNTEVFYHPQELELYQGLEDEFFCSGMCKGSLFWFDKNVTYGPPPQTCLKRFHHYIALRSGGFSLASMMAGLCTLVLFFMHIGLYCRPDQQSSEDDSPNQNQPPDLQMGEGAQVPRSNVYQEGDKDLA